MIDVGVLGPLQVRSDAGPIRIRGRRERCLLALLAVHGGRAVSTGSLLDHLWGGRPPRTARKSLQSAVANLRGALRDAGGDPGCIQTVGSAYRLDPDAVRIDLLRFRELVAAGRRVLVDDPAAASQALAEALALWRGDEPADLGDGLPADIEAQRLADLRLEVLADRLEADLGAGRHHEVLAELGALCGTWPLRERLHELNMLALYRSGRQADALTAARRLRRVLADESGLDPGGRIVALERRILDHDPSLDLSVPPGGGPGRPETDRRLPPLIGRDRDLAAVARLLATRRLVTVVGPGGVGKTALARHLAAGAPSHVWCGLGALAGADQLVPALATAVGVQRRLDVSMLGAVSAVLDAAPTLLVMDNCEHLLDEAAELVRELLATCHDLVVLATSRERLAVGGEVVWPLEGLAVPGPDEPGAAGGAEGTAVQLFVERAQEADPHFLLRGRGRDHVAEICRRLDGLPLALELAAARVRALPTAEIARRLDDRFELLHSEWRGGRHRNLRETVAWSYDLLGTRQQALFRRLAVLPGPFTVETAQAVGALGDLDAPAIPGLLADLVDKSIVAVSHDEPAWRYRLLETLRAFGRERLVEAGEVDLADDAHVAFQRDRLTRLGALLAGPREPEAVALIEGSSDNLRHAVTVARARPDPDALGELLVGLAPYFYFHVDWETSLWAEQALELFATNSPGEPGPHATAAAMAAWGRWFAGDLDRAEEIVDEAAAILDDHPGETGLSHLVAIRALLQLYRRHPDAVDRARRAVALATQAGEDWLAATVAGHLAITHAYVGAHAAAEDWLARQDRISAPLEIPSITAWSLYCRAEVVGDADPGRTLDLARRAAEAARVPRNTLLETIAEITAVTVAGRHGDGVGSLGQFARLIERLRRQGAWTYLMVVVRNLVELLERAGAHEPAAVLLHASPEGAAAPYGRELERLRTVRERLEATMPADAFAAAGHEGGALTSRDTAAYALAAIGRLEAGGIPRQMSHAVRHR